MNYIKRMQAENAALEAKVAAASLELAEFRAFVLTSPKFQGTTNGDRKDWIATTDVATRLENILSLLF